MRLWSLHPKYLDPKGLVALWREALLAQAVLRGETRGYRNHPQLDRFKKSAAPRRNVSNYLAAIHDEACARGYKFDRKKFRRSSAARTLTVTRGQLAYEWRHLQNKLRARDSATLKKWKKISSPAPHPLFRVHDGPRESWER
ncbi:MAG TPA: pyrimidine dimer DNA glycosylase/endonuclease V [Candidatus Eremiobacteraceae bacterium]|nr:pyrimidine dimer DNA glycosylase/endonuclease V [Candidatus Eremiobacteraceae bacterium]